MFHAIIQARMGSKRLPGKVLRSYKNLTPLGVLCGRLKKIKEISKIIVATTKEKKDDKIVSFCKKLKISYFRGSTNNVLNRYYCAAKKFNYVCDVNPGKISSITGKITNLYGGRDNHKINRFLTGL